MDMKIISTLVGDDVKLQSATEGHSNYVHIVGGRSGMRWIVRTPKHDVAAFLVKRSTSILKHLKQLEPSLPVPDVLHQASDFTVLSYLDGSLLGVWNEQILNEARRHQLLRELARFLWQIWTCPTESFHTDHRLTYREWLLEEVGKGLRRSLNYSGWGNPIHFLSRRAKIDSMVPSLSGTPMALRHGDLNALNILVNESGISGIIDWDTALILPLPAVVNHPLFIADIPGWNNDGVSEGTTFEKDRHFLEEEIRKLSAASTLPHASHIPELLESSYERQTFELSLRNKKINEEWAQRDDGVADSVALEHLESFLVSDPAMESNDKLQALRKSLQDR